MVLGRRWLIATLNNSRAAMQAQSYPVLIQKFPVEKHSLEPWMTQHPGLYPVPVTR